jgi:hypothetical protein
MKKIIALKQIDQFQLGHLYEHIFYTHLDTYLRERGMYHIIDYSLDAKTFQNGLVIFDLELYSPAKISFEAISELGVDFNEEQLEIAISQLKAEKDTDFVYDSTETLRRELEQLQNQPWMDVSDTVIVPEDKIAVDTMFKSTGMLETWKLTVSIHFDGETNLIPLARVVTGCIINTLANDAADTFGMFVDSEAFNTEDERTVLHSLKGSADIPDDEALLDLLNETVDEMSDNGAFERLIEVLKDPGSYNNFDPIKGYISTGVLVGPGGWDNLATIKNVDTILQNITMYIDKISVKPL